MLFFKLFKTFKIRQIFSNQFQIIIILRLKKINSWLEKRRNEISRKTKWTWKFYMDKWKY